MKNHPEHNQIFEAAVLQRQDLKLAKEGKYISTRKTRKVKQKVRREMEQLRQYDRDGYTNLANEMLDTKVIWSLHNLRFGTGWLIHNFTYTYKDLKALGLLDGVAEADVGPFLEAFLLRKKRVNLNTTHLLN